MSEELKKELFSLPGIATFLGLAISIWGLVSERTYTTFIVLCALVAILLFYLVAQHRKYSEQKNLNIELREAYVRHDIELKEKLNKQKTQLKNICREFHNLLHRSRDYFTSARTCSNRNELSLMLGEAIVRTLTIASNTFSVISGKKCSASLMLKKRDGMYQTIFYCYNADPDRSTTPSKALHSDEGLIGRALITKGTILWSDKDKHFFATRDDYSKYYLSGICTPLEKSFDTVGVLNIDCLFHDVFELDDHGDLSSGFADMLGLMLECHDVLEGNYENQPNCQNSK